MELLDGGVHVLLEKPISTDIESGLKLLESSKKTTTKVLVGHHRRFNPYLVVAKEAVESKSLGNIIAVNGVWTLLFEVVLLACGKLAGNLVHLLGFG
jgi:predicted dehydrogenase